MDCVLHVIPSQLCLLFLKAICTTNSHINKHKIMLTYVKNAAPVISPHCTNTRHSYAIHFCAVTEQSDVLFAFTVHVNGTIRHEGEKTFQSATFRHDSQTCNPPPFQQFRSTHNALRRCFLQWDVSSSTYKNKLANKVAATSIRIQAARSSKTLTIYQQHGATSDKTKN
jgi:hypothetical protein